MAAPGKLLCYICKGDWCISVVHGATEGTGRKVQQSWVGLGVCDGKEIMKFF